MMLYMRLDSISHKPSRVALSIAWLIATIFVLVLIIPLSNGWLTFGLSAILAIIFIAMIVGWTRADLRSQISRGDFDDSQS